MSQRYCSNCNYTTTTSSESFCPRCGNTLVEQETQSAGSDLRYCLYCGKANPVDVAFCSSCGKPLAQHAQPQSAPQQRSLQDCPPNYLVWAILTTVLCCLPCGVVSIVYSNKVEKLWQSGKYDEAIDASNKARTWAIISAAASAVVAFVYFVIMLLVGLS